MGKTIVEKILAKAAGIPEVSPGEYVQVTATNFVLVGTDMYGELPNVFKRHGWDKLFDPTKTILCWNIAGLILVSQVGPSTSNRENHRINSEFARQMGVPERNILELGRIGNCHHMAVENALALPEVYTSRYLTATQ